MPGIERSLLGQAENPLPMELTSASSLWLYLGTYLADWYLRQALAAESSSSIRTSFPHSSTGPPPSPPHTMVYYIRFLKSPKLTSTSKSAKPRHPAIELVITLTTDLGDSFHSSSLVLAISLCTDTQPSQYICASTVIWPANAHALSISLHLPPLIPSTLCRVHICAGCESQYQPQPLRSDHMPAILDVWSAPFVPSGGAAAPKVAERRLELGDMRTLCVKEEMGESIARHVW